jgi:hypothetical protein
VRVEGAAEAGVGRALGGHEQMFAQSRRRLPAEPPGRLAEPKILFAFV